MPLISIIIPVYDVEAFLPACIESILSQSVSDFEVILVDDGGPDTSGAICDRYAAKDRRIVVIHQENAGVSAARNKGIDAAKGRFLTFIDSDDVIQPDYLQLLLKTIADTGAQISVCQLCEFQEDAIPPEEQLIHTPPLVLTGSQAALDLYAEHTMVGITPCCKLYEASLFQEIRFPVGMRHEDQAIVPIVVYSASAVAVLQETLYCYRARSQSFMHSRFSETRYDDITAVDQCILFFRRNHEKDLVSAAENRRTELIALYSLMARKDGVYSVVPAQYRISSRRALKWMRNNLSDDKYSYRLSIFYPCRLRPHAYWRKIKKTLRIPCN